MSMFTPTATGEYFAGIGLWSTIWGFLYKIESVAKLCHAEQWVSRDRVFEWIADNKIVAFLGTELLNFAMHGISSPDAVLFNMGGSSANVVMIFGIIPIRQARLARKLGRP